MSEIGKVPIQVMAATNDKLTWLSFTSLSGSMAKTFRVKLIVYMFVCAGPARYDPEDPYVLKLKCAFSQVPSPSISFSTSGVGRNFRG